MSTKEVTALSPNPVHTRSITYVADNTAVETSGLVVTSLDVVATRVIPLTTTVGTIDLDQMIADRLRKERTNCPNCGAPLVRDKSRCEYCETEF